ncbi:centromere protein S-like [Mizuhopecten yessoensis]|uniref:Centromere protein S n=1 Tax=Mizuhopecten yessoensis TaxID=6573 RepID=A0A210QWR3_MIZYE|nr:centromere protein S-like [Mizuhopecten yessoensis]OWF53187.1 Centromere protein S [Mizuhopecten yessoensis]
MATEDDDMDNLQHRQRLKASVHHTVVRICSELQDDDSKVPINNSVMAAIAETTWRYVQDVTQDLEMFAKHAKRTTVNADDVKLLLRKCPKLLEHISGIHQTHTESKVKQKKKTATKKKSSAAAVADSDEEH